MDVKGKKIAILGLGESGFQTAFFLQRRGARLWVSDAGDSEQLRQRKEALEKAQIPVEIGKHTVENIIDSSFVVISPGISPRTDIYQTLHKEQVEILSEIELAFRFFSGDVIAVAGTDGKTTVTTLIKEILCGCGMKAISCGNIGNPFIGEIDTRSADTIVILEVSSFQLYHIKLFRPKVAVLLNIAPDHLNWHYNFQDYVDAKNKLFQNQTKNDYAIVNFQDTETAQFLCRIKAQKLFFNQFPSDLDANREAALMICDVYNLDKKRGESIVRGFPGVEHRLEYIPSSDTVVYINDSKSTSLHSLTWALASMKKKVILICGGRNKGLDFTTVRKDVKEKVMCAVVIGEARDEIMQAWKDIVQCIPAHGVEEALTVARTHAEDGDTILFSPACTSFDMFSSYKERGTLFKKLVRQSEKVSE